MSSTDRTDVRALTRAALSIADAAQSAVKRRLSRGFTASRKPDRTFVTQVDREAEAAVRAAVARRFPDHGVLGEELGALNPRAEFQWLVDPIDGTHSLVRGLPLYGTILGLHRRGAPVAGVIHLPALGIRYWAGRGLGAFKNGRRLRLGSGPRRLSDAVISTGESGQFARAGMTALFPRLARRLPHLRGYTDCFGHGLAFEGAVDAMIDPGLRAWDVAASRVIVEEAGGAYRVFKEKAGFLSVVLGRRNVVKRLMPMLAAVLLPLAVSNAVAGPNWRKLWGNPKTIEDHFRRHGVDFGAKTPREYVELAAAFLRRARDEKLPMKVDTAGTIRCYDAATDSFGSYNPDGTVKTFFKPKRRGYWQRQPGALVQAPP